MNAITTLITHNGAFHADDVFACAVLRKLYPTARVVRTRNAALIAAAGKEAIIFDVGGVYDPEANRFDHHQIDKHRRPEGLAYSSFGLIWKHFGLQFVAAVVDASYEDREAIFHTIDKIVVREIDAADNGTPMPDQAFIHHPLNLPTQVSEYLPSFDARTDERLLNHFQAARVEMEAFLWRKIRHAYDALRAAAIVRQAIEKRVDPRWIELPYSLDFQSAIDAAGADEILYALNPSDSGWRLNAVSVHEGSFTSRKPLPTDWAGLRDKELAQVTVVDDAVFCHTGRFVAAATSHGGVRELLRQALDNAED